MKDLRACWDQFATRLEGARRVCVLTDFDGTLTPIVERPELATLPAETRRTLEDLAAQPSVTVGVVSGRAIEDLLERVGLQGIWYVANHGFEIRSPEGRDVRFYEDEDVRFLGNLRDELGRATVAVPGVLLEHKGPVVALHYRLVGEAQVEEVHRAFLQIVEPHHRRLMITRGNRVLEARVRGTCNKGTAVRLIRREHPAGTLFVYFGDDMTDRDAFRALRGFGVSVQVGGDEAILADYTLPAPDAVVETLGRIGEEMRAAKTRTRKRPRKSP